MSIPSHINSFEKGMTKDVNILYQPDGTYRHCVNCSLVSQDGNNYVIKDCLGNVRTFVINRRYATGTTTFDLSPMPIGFISFPDKLIVFSTNDETESGGYGEIGKIEYEPYGEGWQPISVVGNNNDGYIPLYHSSNLKFTKLQNIEGFAFQENDAIKRIYWTDDLNEPRVFDVGNPVYTTYIASGSLIPGQQYMVLEGVITHNAIQYGPTTGTGTIVGNVFTAVNANYTSATGTAPIPKVIQYVPFELLSFTPSRNLGNIKFTEYGTGSLNCGAKMYFYRLTNPSQGINTSWSYGTFPIPVRLGGIGAYFTDLGGGTPTTLVNSGKSVKIQIDNIDQNFGRIQIAVAEFDQLWDVARNIVIVLDEVITSSVMVFEHSSNSNLGVLTLNDLTLFPASILTCKTMTTNKNFILIANIKERGEFAFDNTGVAITEINYPIPAHRNTDWTIGPSCENVMTYVPIDYNPLANPTGANAIIPYSKWVVTSNAGGAIIYNGNNYTVGQVFTGVPGVFTVTIPLTSQLRACTYTNKYTTNSAINKPDATLLTSGYWDYKDPAISANVKGLWIGEKYRYGILFYDKKGNPFYARHLIDVDTSYNGGTPFLGAGGPSISENDNNGPVLYLLQRGVSLSGIKLTPDIVSQISGFSIVRVERDPRIMSQGFLMQTSQSNLVVAGFTTIQPACSHKLSNDSSPGNSPRFYSFLCPDALVNFPIKNFADGIQTINPIIEEAYWVYPKDQTQNGSGKYMKSVNGVNNEAETKYFDSSGGDANSPRKESISSQWTIPEKGTFASFATPGVYYSNNTNTSNTVVIDTQCFTGAANTINTLALHTVGVGGLRTIIELSTDTMLDLNSGVTLYSSLGSSQFAKMMVNYVVDNAAQYGGNTPSALAANNYISTGHFQPINSTVLSETIDVNGNYVFNNIEVWGGDAYTCLIDYGYAIFDDAAVDPGSGAATASYSWGIKFPCQCNSNYTFRNGVPSRKIAPDLMHSNSAGNGIFYKIGTRSQLEGFQYNQAYSSDGHIVAYPALPLNYSLSNLFRYRIRFGGPKFPGELLNSFRTFLINDYKDTDGHGGEINNLRTKDGRTIVWQNAAIDSVPILERQLISGLDGAETALGTGGVVDRFDPISSYFGNQHQWGLTSTEYGFAWFDMRKKAMVVMDFSSGVQEVSMAEGLEGFFNEAFLEIIGNTSPINNDVLNDPTFSKYSDRPLIGVGICGVYDPKFKMTYLTFKFVQRNATIALNKDFTVGYYHPGKQFIAFYDWTPAISWNHNGMVISANNPKNKLKFFAPSMPSTDFVIGDVVPFNDVEYICFSPVTIASYPGTSGTRPDAINSIFWAKINATNELWVHNQPAVLGQAIAPDYLYNSIFGQVINNELQYVVNPRIENPFSVLNMEQEGNNVNFTDIFTSAESKTAQDTSIIATNRFYRVIYDKICSSMPFSFTTGRITNSYLLVRWFKKNWTTDPRVVALPVKILRFIRSFFEEKR